jgi:hypothetical protein
MRSRRIPLIFGRCGGGMPRMNCLGTGNCHRKQQGDPSYGKEEILSAGKACGRASARGWSESHERNECSSRRDRRCE